VARHQDVTRVRGGRSGLRQPGDVGRFGWVVVELERIEPAMLARLHREAWRRTAPAQLRGTLPG
jgi:hypothetical protein